MKLYVFVLKTAMSNVKKNADGSVDVDSILSDMDKRINNITSNQFIVPDFEYEIDLNDDDESDTAKERKKEKLYAGGIKKSVDNRQVTNIRTNETFVDDDESSDGDGDEVLLTHEIDNAGPKAVLEMKSKINTLTSKLQDVQTRYNDLNDAYSGIATEQKILLIKANALEEDNAALNVSLKEGVLSQRQQEKFSRRNGSVPLMRGVNNRRLGVNNPKKNGNLKREVVDDDDNDLSVDLDNLLNATSTFAVIMNWFLDLVPFKEDVRHIQAKLGGSVASYFVFSRYLLIQYILVGVGMFAFTGLHVYNMSSTNVNLWASSTPSSSYIPKFLLYHSYTTAEAVLYTAMVLFSTVVILFSSISKILQEDRNDKEAAAVEAEDEHPFSTEVLGVWDYTLSTHTEIQDLQGSIANVLLQKVLERKARDNKKSRTYFQLFVLYVIRLFGLILYLAWQSIAFLIIIGLTIYHEQIISQIPLVNKLTAYSSIVVNLSLTVISGITPEIMNRITEMERWDSSQVEVSIRLFRVFLSNQLNVLLFVLSYLLLADPYLFSTNTYIHNIRGNIENAYVTGEFNCRLDSVEYQLILLSLTTFLSNLFAVYMAGAGPYIMARLKSFFTSKKVTEVARTEFDIVEFMVNLLNFVMIEMVKIPFAPQILLFTPLFLYISFKWEKSVVFLYMNKPKRPMKAQKAGFVFSLFYTMSFIMIGISVVLYFFISKTFPKSCDIQVIVDDSCCIFHIVLQPSICFHV